MRVTRTERRAAFTLIELLVVISIIAILMALTLAGVSAVRARGMEVQTRSEITQMTTAVQAFMTDFGVSYPPPSNMALDGSGSSAYLLKMFPRWDITNKPAPALANKTLGGDQILVLMLGGPDGLGWSSDPSNPFNTSAGVNRRKPNFDFQASRFVTGSGNAPISAYADPYGKAYCYMSCGYSGNDYGSGGAVLGVNPYIETASPQKFFNPSSCQIISAGKNGAFGPGGNFTAGSGSWAPMSAGADDIANFWPARLGAPK